MAVKTLDQRLTDNDWAFASTPGGVESIEGSHAALETLFLHCFNSHQTLSPGDAGNMLDQSFYLWSVVAACSVVKETESPTLRSYLDHRWPQVPSHWLWTPVR